MKFPKKNKEQNMQNIPTGSEKPEKLTDKVFNRNIAVCVISILICLTSLFTATWAWFSEDIVSNSNVIRTATYNIVITSDDVPAASTTQANSTETAATEPTTITNEAPISLARGQYTIKMVANGTASTGFCGITVKYGTGSVVKYTQQIFTTADTATGKLSEITFELDLSSLAADETATVTFTPTWGTYANTANETVVENGSTLVFDKTNLTATVTK